MYREGKAKGFHVIDAPVTGGDTGAKAGTLSILAGGDKEDFEACMPLFKAMGTNINYQGKAGNGQHAKMANQILIAGALSGVCEAFAYAKAKGLDLNVLLKSVATGAAGSKQLDAFAPKLMTLADDEAKKAGLHLGVLEHVLENYKALEKEGLGEDGTQSLIKRY